VRITRFWYVRGFLSEGRQWLERGLAQAVNSAPRIRARALSCAGTLACAQGDYDAAQASLTASLAIWRELGHPEGIAGVLSNLGMVASYRADYAAAEQSYLESLDLYRKLGARARIAN